MWKCCISFSRVCADIGDCRSFASADSTLPIARGWRPRISRSIAALSVGLAQGAYEVGRGHYPAIVFFHVAWLVTLLGFFVSGLGLGPTLFVTTFIAALAGHGTSVLKAALTSAGITALCLVVFVVALQLRLSILGEWLGG